MTPECLKNSRSSTVPVILNVDKSCCCSQAIALNPNIPTYYTNRALCYMRSNRFHLAIQDARAALDQDSSLVKG